jgi:ketosteroid isomerase-like protein
MSTATETTHVPDSTTALAAARARNEKAWRTSSELLYAGDIDRFMTYWCEDATYEAALPVPGLPPVISGSAALRAAFAGLVGSARSIAVHDVLFHQTDDPDVAVVEERMVAELPDGGRYENRLAIRVTFRDGLIAEMLEYYGQFAHADLLRRLGLGG